MGCYFLFCRVSERQIQIFKADNLNLPLNTVGLDVSPAILIPFYDEDSSTLFLTGKVCIIALL
jgi:coronin-7